ncbi:hypothetical protein [Thalassomonas sp. M1454]|uniref:hypothetical protein n=1 Tax=Thalassomonas sp. M1454 TaxID=2594477 RepID=UPI00117DACF6|nr:hypothetical protein [Thalassomonas sp. M1454]TRX56862.1 hypothetical protein FNN08_04900 [Thalassomonas sp. M1454]
MDSKVLILLITFCITGCATNLPADKQNYIGFWESAREGRVFVSMTIWPSGTFNYARSDDGGNSKINMPITEFTDKEFVSGYLFTFAINSPPTYVDEKWTMVIDGVILTKKDKGIFAKPTPTPTN